MTLAVAPANHEGPSYPPLVLSTDLGGVLNNTVGGGTRRAGLAGDACALSFRGGLASRERTAPGRPRICRCLPVGRCRWAVLFGGVDQERRRLGSCFKIRALPPKRVPTVKPGKRSGRGWKLRAHA